MYTKIKIFCALKALSTQKEVAGTPLAMQNLLKACELEHLRALFQHKNINYDALSSLVDDRASLLVQEDLKRTLYHEIGLDSQQVIKIQDYLYRVPTKMTSPLNQARQMVQQHSKVTNTAFQSRAGSKRVQALLGANKSPAIAKSKLGSSRMSSLLGEPPNQSRPSKAMLISS